MTKGCSECGHGGKVHFPACPKRLRMIAALGKGSGNAEEEEAFWREQWGVERPATCPVCGAPVNDEGCTIEIGHDQEDAR